MGLSSLLLRLYYCGDMPVLFKRPSSSQECGPTHKTAVYAVYVSLCGGEDPTGDSFYICPAFSGTEDHNHPKLCSGTTCNVRRCLRAFTLRN